LGIGMVSSDRPSPEAAAAQMDDALVAASGQGADRPFRPGRGGVARLLLPLCTTLALLGLWEALARSGVLSSLPAFTTIVSWIYHQLGDSAFWHAFGQTVWHWFAGLLLGGIAGIVLGVAIGSIPLVQRLLIVPMELLRPIPAVVYLPLLILVMGSRSQTAIALAAVGSFWPMLFQTVYGVHAIDQQVIETGKVFGLTGWQRLTRIMLPSLMPYLATGVRIASSLALIVAVSIELIGGVPGLGAQLATYSQNADYAGLYGILLVAGVLGLVLNLILERMEKRVLHWHVSHRQVG
jgi:ABC-type nitrate/sulfonate/bicarbonate transport system permease component